MKFINTQDDLRNDLRNKVNHIVAGLMFSNIKRDCVMRKDYLERLSDPKYCISDLDKLILQRIFDEENF